jgi:hypothetical protein
MEAAWWSQDTNCGRKGILKLEFETSVELDQEQLASWLIPGSLSPNTNSSGENMQQGL